MSTACQSAESSCFPRYLPDIATYCTIPRLWFAVLVAVYVHANTWGVSDVRDLDAMIKFLHLIIFQQRIAFPIVRQQNTAMIRMVFEVHAEEVIRFPLMPLGGVPDITHRWDHSIVTRHLDLERDFMAQGRGVKVVDHAECFVWPIINATQTHERVKQHIRVVPQILAYLMDG